MRNVTKFRQGGVSVQMLVLLVPTMLLMMGFAIDLGRMYVIRAELKQATNAMALAAANRLIGNEASLDEAQAAIERARGLSGNIGNRFNFGGNQVGNTDGFLSSQVESPQYFTNAAAAIGDGDNAGNSGDGSGTSSKYVRVSATAEAPLMFFALLSLGQERKTQIAAMSVAGQSAPLCQACGIENFVIPALDAGETANFGYTVGNRYTLACNCTGNPPPGLLADTSAVIRYQILNRQNDEATVFTDAQQQTFRIGLDGMPSDTNMARSCVTVGATEDTWPGAEPVACNLNQPPGLVRTTLCGLAARFDPNGLTGPCENIPDIGTLTTLRPPDTDVTDVADLASYAGSGRRLITVAVVETLIPQGMTILGFRQFLVAPLSGTTLNPSEPAGRFPAIYVGSSAPVRQGRFDGSCGITSGPGKVVLYR
jgi:Flp pilus assembly protein TadG